ncbi:MAG: hypothetical protein J0H64_07980, partial [Actinobacteria bacterium]|nr:hypothetical protein [Actinomycetota bacterium]
AAALERAILQHIERACTPPAGIQPELAANYIAGAATALITSWVLGAVDADEETMAQHLFALMPQWMHSGRPVESRSGEAATRGEPHPELPAATPQRRTEQINS